MWRCPQCSRPSPDSVTRCACGYARGGAAPSGEQAPPRTAPSFQPPTPRPPSGGRIFDVQEFIQTVREVITDPRGFYQRMPRSGGFAQPLVFAIVMGVIAGLLQAVISLLGLRIAAGVFTGIAAIIVGPIVVAIFSFIGAAILFVIWKLMGSAEPYEVAFRCMAYLAALAPISVVFGLIPYGNIVPTAWTTFLLVVASQEVHGIRPGLAWAVFGIIGALLILASVGAEVVGRRVAREMEIRAREAEETSKRMQKAAEEMRKAIQRQQQLQQQPGGQPAAPVQPGQQGMEEAAKEEQKAAEEMRKAIEQQRQQQQ